MQDQQEDYTGVVTASMMWDMLPAEAVIPLCPEAGITPPDAEGAAYELACSNARREAIGSLLPWIEVLGVIAAEIEGIANVRSPGQVLTREEQQFLQENRDLFEMSAHDMIVPAACAIISILVERGFLQVTGRGRTASLGSFLGD